MFEYWFLNNLLAMAIAFMLTGIIIPQILTIAFKKRLFDNPDERKIHNGHVPRLGGIAFVPSIIFAVILTVSIGCKFHNLRMMSAFYGASVPTLVLLCSLMLLFLVGLADDLIGVRYRSKFIFQIVCGLLTIFSGVTLAGFYGFLGVGTLPIWFSWLITLLIVVYIINALNLIDGIDGLCSGLSALALFFYGAVFFFCGEYIYSMLAWATFGTLVPFFYFNMFGDPHRRKKIFMGDTGSMTIGMMIVFLSLEIARITPENQGLALIHIDDVNPLITAYAPLILPLFDVLRVFVHRLLHHRSPFLPDKIHIHHKLLAIGMTQRRALGLILVSAALFMIFNLLVSPYVNVTLLIAIDIIIWTVSNLLLTHVIRRRERRLNCKLYD